MEEREIIASCQKGQLEDFAFLYDSYVQKIYNFLFYRLLNREEAEDLTSQVFLKALESIGKFDGAKASFSTWLYVIARHTLIDFYRQRKPKVNLDDAENVIDEKNFSQEVADQLTLDQVKSYLDSLPEQSREVVLLRVWDGLSHREIAELLNISEVNSKTIFSRAIFKINKHLPLALLLISLAKIAYEKY